MNDSTKYKRIDNEIGFSMKKLLFLVMLLISSNSFGQDWITDSNFDDKISNKSAFGDDEMSIVIVEFWAKFNDANAFQAVSYTHLTLPTILLV